MSQSPRILVVDDDKAVRTVLNVTLKKQNMEVTSVTCPSEALEALHSAPFDLVLTDAQMPGGTGLDLLERIRTSWPEIPVILMTGYGSVEDAVSAIKGGAADYLTKPVSRDELTVVLNRALETCSLKAELTALRKEVSNRFGFEKLIGHSSIMERLYQDVISVAETSASVLLQGATGSGKELLANAIHYRSQRANSPHIRVNCATIPEALLESELFGHERGAFTGAVRQHIGKFESADGGTIFLDEIGEIDQATQVKLLRVLESGEFTRVGNSKPIQVDVRIIAATNKNLREEVREGRFREDLYYRLNVILLEVPPLNRRQEDIPLLVNHFLKEFVVEYQREMPIITESALTQLMSYSWPGNVRQLRHVIERTMVLNNEPEITWFELPKDPLSAPVMSTASATLDSGLSLTDAVNQFERELIIAALKEAKGVQAQAARRLGLSRSNLNYKIGRHQIAVKGVEYE